VVAVRFVVGIIGDRRHITQARDATKIGDERHHHIVDEVVGAVQRIAAVSDLVAGVERTDGAMIHGFIGDHHTAHRYPLVAADHLLIPNGIRDHFRMAITLP